MRVHQLRVLGALLIASSLPRFSVLVGQPTGAPAALDQTQEPATPPAAETRKVGGNVSAPVALWAPIPEFSDEARRAKINGNVLVYLIVDVYGHPQNVHVIRGAGMGLDENALNAVKQYRFKPAMENGKPVPVEMNVEVNFQIIGKPKIIHSVRAELTDEARQNHFHGTAQVRLEVDENGMPKNPHVMQPIGMGLDENALKAVQEYRFKPPKSNGGTVSIPAIVTVEFKKK